MVQLLVLWQKWAAKYCFVRGHRPEVIIRFGQKRVLILRTPHGDRDARVLFHAVAAAQALAFVDHSMALLQKSTMHVTILSLLLLLVLLQIAILSGVADLIPSTLAVPATCAHCIGRTGQRIVCPPDGGSVRVHRVPVRRPRPTTKAAKLA